MAYPFPSSTAGPTGKEAMELGEPPEGPSRRRNKAEGAGGGRSGAAREGTGSADDRDRASARRRRGTGVVTRTAEPKRGGAGGQPVGAVRTTGTARGGVGLGRPERRSPARTTRHHQLLATGRVCRPMLRSRGAGVAGWGWCVCRHRRSPVVNHRQTMSVPLTSTNGSLPGLLLMDEQDNESGPVSGCCSITTVTVVAVCPNVKGWAFVAGEF
ncbi:hypothetical protein D1007_24045 [Hordeum vulgare]|nr:hypothetical protein D1007_24045 [Hordeum vulgare]